MNQINQKRKTKMNINSWNLSQTKTHFFIRQRKQAQRKHLQKLKNTKSSIELLKFTQKSKPFHSSGTQTPVAEDLSQQKQTKSNLPGAAQNSMMTSIIRKVKLKHSNSAYMQNLRVSSSLSRIRHTKEIQKQNQKLYSRLIKAKPSICEMQFKKNHFSHKKYKENILKNKYLNPDYTKEVRTQTKSFSHLMLKPLNNLIKTKQTKTFGGQVKQNLNSHYQNLTNLMDVKWKKGGQI